MSEPADLDAIAALVGDEELHWTVVLDRALRSGAVEPSPRARSAVLGALAALEADGRVIKTSKGTYRAGG